LPDIDKSQLLILQQLASFLRSVLRQARRVKIQLLVFLALERPNIRYELILKLTGFSKDKFLFDPFSVVERVSRFARKFEIFSSSRSISNKLVFGFVVESVGAATKRRSAECHVEHARVDWHAIDQNIDVSDGR